MDTCFGLTLVTLLMLSAPVWANPEPIAASVFASAIAPKATPDRLSEAEIQRRLGTVPGWQRVGDTLVYERTFADFGAAIAFVNALVAPADSLGHHPDITINYNRVLLTLTTHDAGGLTALDFELAAQISQL
ncbi:MAG TPA: 4a-hydroxytetrahydrobiopterin dehydratase [Candidatus Obscuribacterales bacterium]